MKKLAPAVAVLAAAAIGLSTFAACAKKDNNDNNASTPTSYEAFDVTNYAHPLDSAYAKEKLTRIQNDAVAPSKIVKKSYREVVELRGPFVKVVLDDGSAILYDIENDKELYKGLTSLSIGNSCNVDGEDVYVYYLGETKDEVQTYSLVGYDGKVIDSGLTLEDHYTLTNTRQTYTEDEVTYTVLSLTYTKDEKEVEKLFAYNHTKGVYTWKSLSEVPEPEYPYDIGESLSPAEEIYNSELYPDNTSSLKDYEYVSDTTSSSETLTYYKNGQVANTITLNGAERLGYVGDYLFYTQLTYVSSDATSGYNYEVGVSGIPMTRKAYSELYRYNVVEGGDPEKLDVDYVVVSDAISRAYYNYSTNKFDSLLVEVGQKTNGVYVQDNPTMYYIIDENGEVQSQVKGNANVFDIYKLSDSTFLAGRSIVDKNLATLATIPYNNVDLWEEQSLLVAQDGNNTIAIDFDGKIAMNLPNLYSPSGYKVNVYDTAIVMTISSGYSGNTDVIYSKKNPNGKLVTEIVKEANENEHVQYLDGFIVKMEQPDMETQIATVTAYTLDGVKIGDMTVSTSAGSPTKIGNSYVIKGVENDKTVYYIIK